MSYLLRIHIGPVQEFIVAARRSRDLWFGSWLLSELSKAAALGIVESERAGLDALVFPAPTTLSELQPNSRLSVANEIVVVIEGEPTEVAAAAHKKVRTRRDALISDTLTSVRPHLQQAAWDVAQAQLQEFVEFYWVAVPYLEGEYSAARARADRLLAARKNTRTFEPVDWGQPWPKSSLDGARESIIPENDVGDADRMYERYRARSGERLSGVDLLKRLGNVGDDSRFPSTSHMAAMPLKKQLDDSAKAPAAWQDYLDALPKRVKEMERAYHRLRLPILKEQDGSLLFASRLLDHLGKAALKTAEAKLRTFCKHAEIDELNPYYALLVGDGDRIGQAISVLETPDANRALSRTLAGFAAEADAIVHKYDGAMIYAGGDDVLALLPVHTAVKCAAQLAETFAVRLATYGTADSPPTFSAGIAIVHHLEPLEDALALARRAEREAKAIDGKNALAVALDKRSGVPRLVAGKWGALDRRLLNLAALHQAKVIPDRLAYQLLDSYYLLGGAAALASETSLREILALEAERLIERKRVAGGGSTLVDAHKAYVKQVVANSASVAAAADEFVIASLLAKVNDLSRSVYPFQAPEVAVP